MCRTCAQTAHAFEFPCLLGALLKASLCDTAAKIEPKARHVREANAVRRGRPELRAQDPNSYSVSKEVPAEIRL